MIAKPAEDPEEALLTLDTNLFILLCKTLNYNMYIKIYTILIIIYIYIYIYIYVCVCHLIY